MDTLTTIAALQTKTVGRDKIYRTVQYASKLLAWYLTKASSNKELIEKFNKLESNLSLARKLFRIGKPIDFYLEILKQLKNPDAVLRNTISGRAVCLAGWLLLDHLLWFGKIGVINIDMKKWSRRASWFWLTGLLLAVTRDVYQYLKVTEARQRYIQRALQQQPGEPFSVVLNSPAVHQFDKDRRTHIIELVKDVFDLSIPTSSLELLPLSPGLVGLLGLLSSLIGLKQVWPAPSAAK